MFYCEVDVFAPTASFRIPETHLFQQTLPLPPLTTLMGIFGAAIGYTFEKTMRFCFENEIKFGVIGSNKGVFKDLWKYRKIKAGDTISAVLLREYLIDLEMKILIASEQRDLAETIRKSFLNPYYALTAGNSDDLLKILNVSNVIEGDPVHTVDFSQTILPGNHSNNYDTNIDITKIPLMKDIYAPQVQLLPTEFEFHGSERRVSAKKPFTFIDIPIRLKSPVAAIKTNKGFVALL